MSQDTYTVAALAAEVGVPRTTINDWLSRYANFVDTIAVGKRKVYSAATLEVLKTVAALRDSGKSGAEIEQILARDHGVRPEVAEDKREEKAPESAAEPPQETLPAVADNAGSANLPALQNLERSAMELTSFIADLRIQQQQSIRRSKRVSVLLLAVIVVLLAMLAVIYTTVRSEFASRSSEADAMQKNMQKLNAELAAMEKARIAERAAMEKSRAAERAAAERNTAELQSELAALNARRAAMDEKMQQLNKQLANMVNELKNANKKASEQEKARLAEIAALQKEFAAERSKWQQILREQQQLMQSKDAQYKEDLQKKLAAEAEKSQARLQELQKKLEAINAQLEKLNTPPAAAPAAAPAESAK